MELRGTKPQGWPQHKFESGDSLKSIFLEGLKTARQIIVQDGIEKLDDLIAEHELGTIETTALNVRAETR